MRIASIYVPHYSCAVEVQRDPGLAGRPLIISDDGSPQRVLECSAEARAWRVRREMTVRLARGYCPDATVISSDPVYYRDLWRIALDALNEVSPEVEEIDGGRAYLNVGGLLRHYRDEAELAQRIVDTIKGTVGLAACVGIADGKMPAFVASTLSSPASFLIVPPGETRDFLAPAGVNLLGEGPEVISRLQFLGLETLGNVARLSVPELQSQFGMKGKRIWQLACGIDEEPLRPRARQEILSETFVFESSVSGVEVLTAVAKHLFSRLKPRLRDRAVRSLTLQAELTSGRRWENHFVFREAVSEADRLIFLIRSSLLGDLPPMAVNSLTLSLKGLTGETGKQLYFGQKQQQQNQLQEAVQQLKARYGYSPVYRCVDVEPWSVIPEERQILVESDV